MDIILAAGSNTRLGDANDQAVAFPGHAANFANTYPILTAGTDGAPTLIVNTDNEYTYLGRLVVDFDANGQILTNLLDPTVNGAYASTVDNVATAWGLDPATVNSVDDLEATAFAEGTKGDRVKDITDAVQTVISAKDGTVYGVTNVYLEGERNIVRNQETNLGNLSADANAAALDKALGQADTTFIVSLKNGGGIRSVIGSIDVVSGDKLPPAANTAVGKDAGEISLLDIENSLRFNNRLMAFDTTAQGLKAILEHGVASLGNQGRFPQIGGVAFAYDPDLPAGSRITTIGLIDEDGTVAARIYENGAFAPTLPTKITVVTLNFLANGGDGYPIKANGENFRFLLNDGTLSAPLSEALNFASGAAVPANALGEQQAFFEFLQANHATAATAYNQADTAIALDTRIQNLNFRSDTVLAGETITGTNSKDNLVGTVGDDTINAGLNTDTVSGGDGDDIIDGGEGLNVLNGDAGDDTITGGSGKDVADGGTGDDVLNGGGGNDTLDGGDGDDLIAGGKGNDVIRGGAGIDTVDYSAAGSAVTVNLLLATSSSATEGSDRVVGIENAIGSDFGDTLIGSAAVNVLEGGDGDDHLYGGLFSDTLTGGEGADTFYFNTRLQGVTDVDTITDFEVGIDTIALSASIFRTAGPLGELGADAFSMGTAATALAHRIIFDDATGELFYDRDGTGAAPTVKFAVLEPGLDLTNADFSIVA